MEQAREVISWDQYFMNIAKEVAQRSKDPSTQVWCVIVDEERRPISFGYNGFIAWGDESYMTWERPQKYYGVIHAEMNAILFAKRSLKWATLYVNYACCENCLKFIIQAGNKKVIDEKSKVNSAQNGNSKTMTNQETLEAITRIIKTAEPLGFTIKNLNGKSYLEEIWGSEGHIPDFREKS